MTPQKLCVLCYNLGAIHETFFKIRFYIPSNLNCWAFPVCSIPCNSREQVSKPGERLVQLTATEAVGHFLLLSESVFVVDVDPASPRLAAHMSRLIPDRKRLCWACSQDVTYRHFREHIKKLTWPGHELRVRTPGGPYLLLASLCTVCM